MIIKPRVRGFVCVTSHPSGCEAHVQEWIEHVKSKGPIKDGPKKVLILGSSTGFGLASRITAAFGAGAGEMAIEDALGFEVLLSVAKLEFGELELLLQQGVLSAQREAELKQPHASQRESGGQNPRQRRAQGGAATRAGWR